MEGPWLLWGPGCCGSRLDNVKLRSFPQAPPPTGRRVQGCLSLPCVREAPWSCSSQGAAGQKADTVSPTSEVTDTGGGGTSERVGFCKVQAGTQSSNPAL